MLSQREQTKEFNTVDRCFDPILDERRFAITMINGSMHSDNRREEVPNTYGFFVSPNELE